MSSAVFTALRPWLALWLLFGVASAVLIGSGVAHGPSNYFWLFTVFCWAARDAYWSVAAAGTKPDAPAGGLTGMALFLIYALYCLPLSSVPFLGCRLMPRSFSLELAGALLCVLGNGFAIWARRVLARSWSPAWTTAVPSADGGKLVRTGPYAIVRHPIYFGFLVAAAGMFMVLGEMRALGLLLGIGFILQRMSQEEAALQRAFPVEYPEYERQVKKLLPGIW